MPLAFVSLPLYVSLPHYYASTFGLSLSVLGTLLLLTRLADAFIDPLVGRWLDRLFARGLCTVWASMALACMLLLLGLAALWWPPVFIAQKQTALLIWLALALTLTYISFSWATIAHQAWSARWGGSAVQRARWIAWREGAALVGVMVASVVPSLLGQAVNYVLMSIALALAMVCLGTTRRVVGTINAPLQRTSDMQSLETATVGASAHGQMPDPLTNSIWLPWRTPGFTVLYVIFSLNGIASAVPATLLLFFVADVLQAEQWQPVFLASYFFAAAVGIPLWVACVRRWGLHTSWLMGMAMSIGAFAITPWLTVGSNWTFLMVCLVSGLALGADLVVPGALLAGLVGKVRGHGPVESRFFSWWALAGKLNLALAAGIALPLLGTFGYSAGTTQASALLVLSLAYGLVPCVLKLLALVVLLWHQQSRHPDDLLATSSLLPHDQRGL